MKHRRAIVTDSKGPPVVELDSDANAAYVRFTRNPIARTEPVDTDEAVVTIDFDADGRVVGVELVGVAEFSVTQLLRIAGPKVPRVAKAARDRVSYIPAGRLQTA